MVNNKLATLTIVILLGIVGFAITGIAGVPSHAAVKIPSHAVEIAPGLYDLGQAVVDGEVVQGYMFIDFKKAAAKPSGPPKPGNNTSTCYAFLSSGAKWKQTEQYTLNPANADGINDSVVASNIAGSLNAWDAQVAFPIFSSGNLTASTLVADTVSPDNVNEVYFSSIDGTGSIAVTIVWGVFSGPPSGRKLIEWDMVFDDAEFAFGNADINAAVMDLLSIATHESGHAAGMDHPDGSCTEETMYAYASTGETKKRTLNSGDIAGIKSLYK